MPLALRFVVASLAAWRLAFLLVREDGPGGFARRLRESAAGTVLARPLACVKCTGMWVALPLTFFVGHGLVDLVMTWLAISGVVALVDEWTRPPFEWKEPEE